MSWQDLVFTIGQFIFVLALVPTIKGKDKPAFATSSVTSFILFLFFLTYISLSLWGSAAMAFLNSVAWGIIGYQKFKMDNQNKSSK